MTEEARQDKPDPVVEYWDDVADDAGLDEEEELPIVALMANSPHTVKRDDTDWAAGFMSARAEIDALTAENAALRAEVERLGIVVALAIGRLERHEPGAALTGLRAALAVPDGKSQETPNNSQVGSSDE